MPKFFPRTVKASDLNHNDLSGIGASDHHVKYTDAEAVAAAKADADIADAVILGKTPWDDTGLVLYLPFDENNGVVAYDKSFYKNNGAFKGAGEPAWSEGHKNVGVNFDGVNDYVEVPDSDSLDISTVFTIEAWHKRNTNGTGLCLEKGDWSVGWDLVGSSLGAVNLRSLGFGTKVDHDVAEVFDAGQWVHLVITYDSAAGANNLRFYKNGVLKQSFTETGGLITNAVSFKIGRAVTGTYFTNGKIDEVRIYNRALTAAEIKAHYLRS